MIKIKETAAKNYLNGQTFVLKLLNTENNEEKIVEAANINLPVGTEERGIFNMGLEIVDENSKHEFWNEKWTVAVSLQTGCPNGCKFCSVADFSNTIQVKNLSCEEILAQFVYALSKVNYNPKETKLFRVMLARMGEPTANLNETIKFIRVVKNEIPNARFYISTTATYNYSCDNLIDEIIKLEEEYREEFIDLQFSVHSTNNEQRRYFQNKDILPNEEIAKLINKYYYAIPDRSLKVKLNFALSLDSDFDLKEIRRIFDPKTVFIKFSMLAENEYSDKFGIKSLNKKIPF